MALQEIAEDGGIPGEDDAPRAMGGAEQRVQRGRVLALHEWFGPGNDDGRKAVQLQHGAGDERAEIGDAAGEHVAG